MRNVLSERHSQARHGHGTMGWDHAIPTRGVGQALGVKIQQIPARCRSPASPRDHALGASVCAVVPSGGQRCWLLWGFGGHLGGGLVPPGDPQSQATLSSPAPRAQGGLLDGAPAAPKDPRDHFSARADDMIVHMKCFGTRQASAKPLPVSYTHLTLPTICSV